MVEYIQNSGLVDALGIFANVLLVVCDQLSLYLKRPLKGTFYNEFTNNSGHSAQDAVVKKERAAHRHLYLVEGREISHMLQHIFDEGIVISFSPQEFLEIQ